MVFICLGIYVSSLFGHNFFVIIYIQQFISLWCGGGVGINEENSPIESVIKLRNEVFIWNDDYGNEKHEAIDARQKGIK